MRLLPRLSRYTKKSKMHSGVTFFESDVSFMDFGVTCFRGSRIGHGPASSLLSIGHGPAGSLKSDAGPGAVWDVVDF
jgi:hypothetical protein